MNLNHIKIFFIFFIISFILRLYFFIQINSHPVSKLDFVFISSDMYTNLEWSKDILNGDILGKNTYHPFHKWMSEIAPLSKWHDWWGGKEIFQQVPFYPYFLAFLMKIFNNDYSTIRLFQILIGSISIGLIAVISAIIFGNRASYFSGLVGSFYFPFYCYEFYFLRDFLSVHFLCWLILIMVLNNQKQKNKYYFFIGILCAILALTRENFLILIFGIWFLIPKNNGEKYFISISKSFVLLGIIIILSLLFIRNYFIGAPIFSFSNRLLESLIEGNSFDSNPFFMTLNSSFKKYFYDGEGDAFKTFAYILKDYNGILPFMIFQFKKIFYLFYYLEPYNNLNLYFFKTEFFYFELFPDYAGIIIFGIIGLYIYLIEKKPKFIVSLFFILALSILIGPVLARYRLILVPFYLIWLGLFYEKCVIVFNKINSFRLLFYLFFIIIFVGAYLNNSLPKDLKERELEAYYINKLKTSGSMQLYR